MFVSTPLNRLRFSPVVPMMPGFIMSRIAIPRVVEYMDIVVRRGPVIPIIRYQLDSLGYIINLGLWWRVLLLLM